MVAPHQTPEVKSSATASASKRPGIREHGKRPMFDTLQVANDLKKGGFSAPQAEALVSAFSAVFQNMVTKADLKAALKDYPTRAELKAELKAALEGYATRAELRAELKSELKAALEGYATKADLAALETRLTLRLVLMTGIIVGAIGLLVKL